MKKIFQNLFILTIVFILTLTGCQKKESNIDDTKKEMATPLFYKISNDKNDTIVYLLGSIHAADDSVYPLNDTIMKAYKNSDYLAVEIDTIAITSNFDLQLELAKKMLYIDGTTIKDELGEELYNKMVEFLNTKNSYNSLYDNYKPAFFESLFENVIIKDAEMDANKGIDTHFLNLAKKDNKSILEIETANFQYDLLLSNPIELDRLMLNSYVDDYDNNVLEMKELYNAWKKGDIKELEEKLFSSDIEELTADEITMLEHYNQTLITDRNYGMVKALEKYISEDKNVFCVVGLGHVIGDEGIVNLMQKNGYKIEKLS